VARFLDDPLTRAAAAEDPGRFVRHDGLMLIDEVQRVPDIWLAIKNVVDREPRPGSSSRSSVTRRRSFVR
jgi:predicted AAA+ superfamily ATPase